MFTMTLLLIYYLNFKLGASQDPSNPAPHEVRDRDYFFLWSFSAWGVWAALGLIYVWESVAALIGSETVKVGRETVTLPKRDSWRLSSPVLVLALVPLFANWHWASRAGHRDTADFAADLLNSVEPYGVLITVGDNDTFPLWYAQEVEGIRPDITLANLSLMNTEWHLRQLARRVTPAFDPSRADPIWHNVPVPPHPTTPALALTQAEVDSLPEAMQVPKSGGIAFDSLQIRFGQDVLLRQDLASIFLIRDNQGKRPIFFSWSDGGYPDQTLGLSPYLVSQGFVRKLMPTPVRPTETVHLSPGLGYVDVARTRTLLSDVYHWQTATRRRPFGWVDAPSGSILQLYSVVYGGSARVFEQVGDTARAMLADSVAREVNRELNGRSID